MAKPDSAASVAGAADAELLVRVAQARDRAAFETLYERYHGACFNLAMRITGSREHAEEAVQEAFLRVWRYAHTYQPGGEARSWIFRVLARASIARMDAANRNARIKGSEMMNDTIAHDEPVAVRAERGEELAALRGAVDRLPRDERLLVALYYGAGFSQEECGKELGVPTRTVSDRLKRVLGGLREHLTQAGFAAAVPLLDAHGLGQALTHGPVPEARIFDGILAKIEASARASARAAKTGGPGTLVWAGGVLIATGVLAAVVYRGSAPEGRPAQSVSPPAMPDAKTEVQPAAKRELFHKSWTFEKGLPKDIAVLGGQWTLAKNADDGTQALAAAPGEALLLRLPVPDPAAPSRIEIEMNFIRGNEKSNLKILKLAGRTSRAMRLWRDPNAGLDGQPRRAQVLVSTFDGRNDVTTINGTLASVARIEPRVALDNLVIEATAAVILSIEYRELEPGVANEAEKHIADLEARGVASQDVPAQTLKTP
ncbi:MAG: sigma-70 family RNA polymerase sigma factor [Planctomycetes bacterium]|nr:sigma-70 family RNA polymerase sigma factor [Planctomycetota bacterium]